MWQAATTLSTSEREKDMLDRLREDLELCSAKWRAFDWNCTRKGGRAQTGAKRDEILPGAGQHIYNIDE